MSSNKPEPPESVWTLICELLADKNESAESVLLQVTSSVEAPNPNDDAPTPRVSVTAIRDRLRCMLDAYGESPPLSEKVMRVKALLDEANRWLEERKAWERATKDAPPTSDEEIHEIAEVISARLRE